MGNQPSGLKELMKRCTAASSYSGTVWLALAAAFLALGISGPSAAYLAVGAAFLAIGLGVTMKRKRRHASPE